MDGLVILFVIAAGASVFAGLRSRRRVRALLDEPVADAPRCAIDRPRVQRFFEDTRILRALVGEAMAGREPGIDLHHSRDDNAEPLAELLRAADRWARAFAEDLDDDDRTELHERGITSTRVARLRSAAAVAARRELVTLGRELADIEESMTLPARQRAYR